MISQPSLPSEVTNVRHWRTREDPFSTVWEQVRQQIEENPGLEAKTLFEWLQREYPWPVTGRADSYFSLNELAMMRDSGAMP